MMKEGTWDAYYKNKQLLQQSFTDNSQNLMDFDEVEHVVNFSIGTPAQTFTMHLDVTSMFFWVPTATCGTAPTKYCPPFCSQSGGAIFCDAECVHKKFTSDSKNLEQACVQKSKFDPSKSSTYVANPETYDSNIDFEFGYISLSQSGKDNLELGPISVEKDEYFSQAIYISPAFTDTPFDGILGLNSNFMSQARSQFDEQMYMVYFEDTDNNYDIPGGYITFGGLGLDKDHCNPEIDYQFQQPNYGFSISNISFGNVSTTISGMGQVDTSRTSILGPADIIKTFKEAAGTSKDGTINCDAKIGDLTFSTSMKNGFKTYIIPAKFLIIKTPGESCSLALDSMPPNYGNSKWIFGTPWFRSYCNIFTFGSEGAKIGFAKIII